MKKKIAVIFAIVLSVIFLLDKKDTTATDTTAKIWKVQSIDTMKYSRDLSREKLKDASFDKTIEEQLTSIAKTGATHVAIATPYDEEFLPILTRWVKEAREQNLNVWFRGNFSGWEGWFNYDDINREQHLKLTAEFITKNQSLFQDGDIFTSCPECENGGPGDPRMKGDKAGFQKFMIDSYKVTSDSFNKIGKKVESNYFSMNGDVANLVMDRETTSAIDGIVVIDHYVKTPEKMISDIRNLAAKSGGKIVLGEWGAPIPDIHGKMTEAEQAEWIDKALLALYNEESVVGLNYWTAKGGSTELWKSENRETEAVAVLRKYFSPELLEVMVVDGLNRPISGVSIKADKKFYKTNSNGVAAVLLLPNVKNLDLAKEGYATQENVDINSLKVDSEIVLQKTEEGLFFRFIKFIKGLFS